MAKRLIAAVTALLMFMVVFSGMAGASETEQAGTWYLASGQQNGMNMDASLLSAMGMNMTLVLNEDGTAVMNMSGTEQQGAWDEEKSVLMFNEVEIPYEIKDGTLQISQEDGAMIFSREKPEVKPVELAPEVSDPQPGDFNGTWKAVTYVAMELPLPLKMMGSDFTLTISDGVAHYQELIYDMNDNFAVTETIEHDFTATPDENGTLTIDFAGEAVLSKIAPGAGSIILTLHEDGQLTGTVPELDEQMEMLKGMSAQMQNAAAEAAENNEAAEGASEGGEAASEGGSSGDSAGKDLSVYFILEKAE